MSFTNKSGRFGSLNSENRTASLQYATAEGVQNAPNASDEGRPKSAIDFAAAALINFRHMANTEWTRK